MDEVTELVDWIKTQNGELIQLHRKFSLAVVNALWQILTGTLFEHDNSKLLKILDLFSVGSVSTYPASSHVTFCYADTFSDKIK
jgi:hypothetical protein